MLIDSNLNLSLQKSEDPFLFGYSKELLMFLCFERDFLTCLLLFFRKSEFSCRKGVG